MLHLATHGFTSDSTPMYSSVLLSPTGKEDDGLLEAREIMNLDLHARLMVLSACETARGRVGEGEGMIGLTWALSAARVPCIIASQWEVDSESTTKLMLACIATSTTKWLATSDRSVSTAKRVEAAPRSAIRASVLLGRVRGRWRPELNCS